MSRKKNTQPIPFSEKMIHILNAGALNLAMGIGYQTGLFDVMDQMTSPAGLPDIAAKSGLSQRYIQEWMGVMVSGGIVEISTDATGTDLFYLPTEHGDLLTRSSGSDNLGVYSQEIPLLTMCAMEGVVNGFSTGEGISYDHYPRFQQFMTELANAKHMEVLVNCFLPSVGHGKIIKLLSQGIDVCDLGCGEGVAAILMAEAFPNSRFTGIDISNEALNTGKANARSRGLINIEFIRQDAAKIKDDPNMAASFDYITAFDAIHDQSRPLDALKSVHAMLKPDGIFSMVDIAAQSSIQGNMNHPMGQFLYTVSLMHCMPVGLMDNGTGLGMMWGEEKAIKMLGLADFSHVEVLKIPRDSFNLHYFCNK
ncbi:MAG: class I SAM-dependent methyltransferase [Deltaproteobacteria bacterium]|nr:class I SAM-dependent methyltransferase [Deltaproteobacteria bacterium]